MSIPTLSSFTGNFKTIAAVKNATSYGLFDNEASGSIDYNPPAFSRANYQENKKRPWAGGGAAKAKKGKWGSASFGAAAATDSPASSGGWKGKKRNFKSKFSKFKKRTQ